MKRIIFLLLILGITNCLSAQKSGIHNPQLAVAEISVAQLDSYDAILFPNPVTNGVLNVKSLNYILSVEILNVIGYSIQKKENKNLSKGMTLILEDCEKGIYLVKVSFGENKHIIKKILVK